jgi:hypothetical protein
MLVVGIALGGCFGGTTGSQGGAQKSPVQMAYDGCVDFYNNEWRYKPKERAVYGSSNGGCWGVWGRETLQQAHDEAYIACTNKVGGVCWAFADSNGLSEWAQRVSNNGGKDPGVSTPSPNATYSSGSNQSCTPVPPDCQNANDRGQAALANLPAATGIHDSAGQEYCSLLILIEVNEYCSMSYRAIGKSYCADLTDQQAQEYRSALYQAETVLDASAASGARHVCTWQ